MGLTAEHQELLGMKVLPRPTIHQVPAWLEPGCSFDKAYELGRHLGKGSFGDVWSCLDKLTGKEFAVKVVQKASLSSEAKAALKTEISVLKQLKSQHPGVVQIQEVVESSTAIQVVMEMCSGGELFDLLSCRGWMPERSARLVFTQLASTLAYCHSVGIIHRDIKPENILFDRPAASLFYPTLSSPANRVPQAKLADFGLAHVLTPGETTVGCTGSRYYTAPEMIQGKRYGRRVDVWSLGVVLATMLTGKLPFSGKTPADTESLKKAISKAKVNFNLPCWFGISDAAKDLVSKMLQAEPQKRPRASELLAHPWCSAEEPVGDRKALIPVTQSFAGLSLNSFSLISRTTTCTSTTSHSTDILTLCSGSGHPSPRTEAPDLGLLPSNVREQLDYGREGEDNGCFGALTEDVDCCVEAEDGRQVETRESHSVEGSSTQSDTLGEVWRERNTLRGTSLIPQVERKETLRQPDARPVFGSAGNKKQRRGILNLLRFRKPGTNSS